MHSIAKVLSFTTSFQFLILGFLLRIISDFLFERSEERTGKRNRGGRRQRKGIFH